MSRDALRLKSELVKTRKVITNKFKKMHSERMKRDRLIDAKFAPITNSIGALIKSKENILTKNSQNDKYNTHNIVVDNDSNGVESSPQYDGHIEVKNEQYDDDTEESPPRYDDNSDENVIQQHNDNIDENAVIDFDEYESAEENNDSWEDDDIEMSDNIDDKNRIKRRREEYIAEVGETKRMRVNKQAIQRELAKKAKKKQQLRNIDEIRQYTLKKLNQSRATNTTKIDEHQKRKVVVSPDDFDIETGVQLSVRKPKRRKILVSPTQLVTGPAKRKSMKAVGTSLEKNFIPYNANIVYEYYDDPNELCDRLKLLISSKGAGNTNHDQEINSIVEELRERGIIE